MKKIWKYLIGIFLFVSFFLILFIFLMNSAFFKENIYIAHLSYLETCIPESSQAIQDKGFIRMGQTTQTTNQTTGEKKTYINISVPPEFPEERLKTIKHELCHNIQLSQNRVFPCITYLPRLSNEIECYIAEDLSNERFEEKYTEIREI